MKKITYLLLIAIASATTSFAQENKTTIPTVDVKNLEGKTISTSTFQNDGKPMIISFWATWCKPCVQELTTISEVYSDWQEETGVKLIAISIDNSRTSGGVLPLVNGKDWDYEVYLDENGDFKRAMGVNVVPHTFLVNGKGEIVWQHTSFTEGAELELIDKVRELIAADSNADSTSTNKIEESNAKYTPIKITPDIQAEPDTTTVEKPMTEFHI